MLESDDILPSSKDMTFVSLLSSIELKKSTVMSDLDRYFVGLFLPNLSCELANSFEVIAEPVDMSRDRHVAAMISASLNDFPGPAQFMISRHSFCVGSFVPPPTVPITRDGRYAVKSMPLSCSLTLNIPTEDSWTHAMSCPVAVKIPAIGLAKLIFMPTMPTLCAENSPS